MASYGATLDGVKGLVPHRRLDDTSQPSAAQAGELLERVSGWVEARAGSAIGQLSGDQLTAAQALARTAIELGAAALVQDAAHPDKAAPADTSYGTVLWSRYREALADLLRYLGLDPDGDEGAGAGEPAYSFPEPLWDSRSGF